MKTLREKPESRDREPQGGFESIQALARAALACLAVDANAVLTVKTLLDLIFDKACLVQKRYRLPG